MENFGEIESDIDKLRSQLDTFGIDTVKWGTGIYKTIYHLADEIKNGEIILKENKDGELIRVSEIVATTIYFTDKDGKTYRLKEQKQVFNDGRERVRQSEGQAVFEKMKSGEEPAEAILRGINEELGINCGIVVKYIETIENFGEAGSYPGMSTESKTHYFETILEAPQFQPQGYIEEQSDKITYFVWELID